MVEENAGASPLTFRPCCRLFAAAPPVAADTSETDRAEIVRVIGAQMNAFQRDDGDRGLLLCGAPSIRSMFQTPDRFMMMVQRGYKPVYRPQDVQFLDLVESEGRPLAESPGGRARRSPVMAVYTMEPQPDGPGASPVAFCSSTDAPPDARVRRRLSVRRASAKNKPPVIRRSRSAVTHPLKEISRFPGKNCIATRAPWRGAWSRRTLQGRGRDHPRRIGSRGDRRARVEPAAGRYRSVSRPTNTRTRADRTS